jgi:hypothetical protein
MATTPATSFFETPPRMAASIALNLTDEAAGVGSGQGRADRIESQKDPQHSPALKHGSACEVVHC